jgi:cyanate permease
MGIELRSAQRTGLARSLRHAGGCIGLASGHLFEYCSTALFGIDRPASSAILSFEARPAGIALINCVGIGGGSAIGPLIIGYLKDATGSFTSGLLYVVAMLIMGIMSIAIVARQIRVATRAPNPSAA